MTTVERCTHVDGNDWGSDEQGILFDIWGTSQLYNKAGQYSKRRQRQTIIASLGRAILCPSDIRTKVMED